MRFFIRKRRSTPTIIIVALIDVLIVLLIFLMVTTTFKQQSALKLALPESSQSEKAGAIVEVDDRSRPVLRVSAPGLLAARGIVEGTTDRPLVGSDQQARIRHLYPTCFRCSPGRSTVGSRTCTAPKRWASTGFM